MYQPVGVRIRIRLNPLRPCGSRREGNEAQRNAKDCHESTESHGDIQRGRGPGSGGGPITIYLNLAQIVAKIWLPAAIYYRRGGGGGWPIPCGLCGCPILPRALRKGGIPWSHLCWDLVRLQSLIHRRCQGSRTAVRVGVPVVCRRNAVRARGQCRGSELCHASA